MASCQLTKAVNGFQIPTRQCYYCGVGLSVVVWSSLLGFQLGRLLMGHLYKEYVVGLGIQCCYTLARVLRYMLPLAILRTLGHGHIYYWGKEIPVS